MTSMVSAGFHGQAYKAGEVTVAVDHGTLTCGLGEYFTEHHSACVSCERGSYCVYEFKFLCPAGKYQPRAHAAECYTCADRSFAAVTGSTSCLPCPKELPFSPAAHESCCASPAEQTCQVPAGRTMAPSPAPTPSRRIPAPSAGCAEGYHHSESAGLCSPCRAGSYSPSRSRATACQVRTGIVVIGRPDLPFLGP